MVNSFALRQQFEWAFEGIVPREELWHDYDARAHGYDERIRRQTEEMFRATDVFILTLGLSEVWYDTVTGGVFWRAVPQNRYDPSRHRFRVSTVAENRENLAAIHRLIATHRPEAKVILTLSPVPLVATFRPVSCITANSASKAILRAALDEFLREADDPARLFYWPSYEIVTGVFDEPFKPDRRHVKEAVLGFVMTLFEHAWCSGAAPRHSLLEAWVGAQAAAGPLPRPVLKAVEARDAAALDDHASRLAARGNPAAADLLARLAREYRAPAAGDATG